MATLRRLRPSMSMVSREVSDGRAVLQMMGLPAKDGSSAQRVEFSHANPEPTRHEGSHAIRGTKHYSTAVTADPDFAKVFACACSSYK